MKIALIGYGKMGQMIEKIALERGHEIVLKITIDNTEDFTKENLAKADVAIEFSGPDAAYDNIIKCLTWSCPVVSGSTGWLSKKSEVEALVHSTNGSFIYASNYSLGVNLFFALNEKLAAIMKPYKQYDVTMEEIHHTAKQDAPSGTAITLAEGVLSHSLVKNKWVNDVASTEENEINITSLRIDPYPGTHSVRYSSEVDDIEITHTAKTRHGFALGATLAAEYIYDKEGIFNMKQVLDL
ncbi:MAG: 4-hydroxy-tetrahydrodipicolinate reductase [Saprospiraceae bacterium]|nr:4-hydroxy-tetrahydrodipicolinate reductase [Saprospiraceae bacterium]MBK8633504.1 4-hydroxy-tetrahydrodipicolinate reductase [Saprospiraceae bacterium]MBP7644043.1 4-hydroxy-tetrahydrodipicolinate reductase [Saprospiraceae bacterium]